MTEERWEHITARHEEDDTRQTVLQIITSPPVNAILKVFSYTPTLEADQVEPLAFLDQPVAMPL